MAHGASPGTSKSMENSVKATRSQVAPRNAARDGTRRTTRASGAASIAKRARYATGAIHPRSSLVHVSLPRTCDRKKMTPTCHMAAVVAPRRASTSTSRARGRGSRAVPEGVEDVARPAAARSFVVICTQARR